MVYRAIRFSYKSLVPRSRFPTSALHTMSPARFPPHFASTDHRQRSLLQLRSKQIALEKYIYLNGLKERDSHLFYDILLENMQVSKPSLPRTKLALRCFQSLRK
jgi:hypothetical protein